MSSQESDGLMGNGSRGAEVEAHAGTIRIPTAGTKAKPRRRLIHLFREGVRARRRERVIRNYAPGTHRAVRTSVQGSEHTHLILPPKAY